MRQRIRLFLMALVLVSSGFAMASSPESVVTVYVDGVAYSCTRGDSPNPGGPCEWAAQSFKTRLEACMQNYDGPYERAGKCIENNWPGFKRAKPDCVYEGSLVCYQLCLQYYDGPYEKTSKCSSFCQ